MDKPKKGKKRRRKKIFANRMHRDLTRLFLLVSLVPAIIVAVHLFYYLIVTIMISEYKPPGSSGYEFLLAAKNVMVILFLSVPVCVLAIIIFSHNISHKIVGPFERIVRELDEIAEGKREGPIVIRKDDRFLPLVEKINKLLDKFKKS